jgi:hypothetical protein
MARCLLEAFVLAELAGQRLARVLLELVVAARRLGQQQARLHPDEARGHRQEIGQHARAQQVDVLDVGQELVRDLRQRHGADIKSFPLDQVQQQI